MREPVQRTWSHYAMWALYYKWEKQRDVVSLLAREMNQTVRCNASLALHPSRLLELQIGAVPRLNQTPFR